MLCSVSKGDLPVDIRWYKDGRLIKAPAMDVPGISVIHVSPFSSNLVYDGLRPEHRGNYTCEAANGAGSVTFNGTMIIHGESHLPPYLASCR